MGTLFHIPILSEDIDMAIVIKGIEYEVRELTFEDSKILSEILDKTGFDLKNFNKDIDIKRPTKEQISALAVSVASDMAGHIVRNFHKAHKEVKVLLGGLIGVGPDEFAKMPITTPILIIKELSKTINLTDFLKSAVG